MSHPLVHTGVRLVAESRSGTKEAIAYGFANGSGQLWRRMKITYYFENGSYYRELQFDDVYDDPDATWTEIGTDYDPNFNGGTDGSGYGDPEDPAQEYLFYDRLYDTDVKTYMEGIAPTWEDWEAWFEIKATATSSAHDQYTASNTLSSTSFTITLSDNAEGLVGSYAGASTHLEPRLMLLTPIPAKIQITNGDDPASTETLTPGSYLEPGEVKIELDAEHDMILNQLQWLPWSGV